MKDVRRGGITSGHYLQSAQLPSDLYQFPFSYPDVNTNYHRIRPVSSTYANSINQNFVPPLTCITPTPLLPPVTCVGISRAKSSFFNTCVTSSYDKSPFLYPPTANSYINQNVMPHSTYTNPTPLLSSVSRVNISSTDSFTSLPVTYTNMSRINPASSMPPLTDINISGAKPSSLSFDTRVNTSHDVPSHFLPPTCASTSSINPASFLPPIAYSNMSYVNSSLFPGTYVSTSDVNPSSSLPPFTVANPSCANPSSSLSPFVDVVTSHASPDPVLPPITCSNTSRVNRPSVIHVNISRAKPSLSVSRPSSVPLVSHARTSCFNSSIPSSRVTEDSNSLSSYPTIRISVSPVISLSPSPLPYTNTSHIDSSVPSSPEISFIS